MSTDDGCNSQATYMCTQDMLCLGAYCGFAVCAGSTELVMALRALGERHELSGLRVWSMFARGLSRHAQHPPQYSVGRPACAALRV